MSAPPRNLMAGVSGVRGITPEGFDAPLAAAYALAYASHRGEGPILLARDPRESGGALLEAITGALTGCGRDVIDLGIVPTPTLLMNTALLGAAGGIVITASHNPVEWNGMKFADPGGRNISPADSFKIIEDVESGRATAPANRGDGGGRGSLQYDPGALARHMDIVAAAGGVDTGAIAGAGISVVVDGCGGAAAELVPAFLEGHGVEVHRLYCEQNGTFPRPPEPVAESLGDLCGMVVEKGAGLGLATDPDGDRLAIVGPDGIPLGEEATIALASRRVLDVSRGPVVVNLSTSRMVDDVAEAAGVRVVRTAVGETNVVEGMLAEGAVVGGEGNGGVIHPGVVLGRDALTGAALILSAMAAGGVGLLDLRSAIPHYSMLKTRYALPGGGAGELRSRLEGLPAAFPDVVTDSRDGLRLDWEDRWVHIRPSNTEPIVRIISEAPLMDEAVDQAEEIALMLDLRDE